MLDPNTTYFPDRFYIQYERPDPSAVLAFLGETDLEIEDAVFVHEYYHYLSNVATVAGARTFYVSTCVRYDAIVKMSQSGLDFPIETDVDGDSDDPRLW